MTDIEFKDADAKAIHDELQSNLSKTYSYFYGVVDKDTYETMVMNIIEEIKNDDKDKKEKRVFTTINKQLADELEIVLSNTDKAYNYISNIISEYSFKDMMTFLNKIEALFQKNGVLVGYETIVRLFEKNKDVSDFISDFVSTNYKLVVEDRVDDIYPNMFLCQLVDIYCEAKNIEVKRPESDNSITNYKELENLDDNVSLLLQEIGDIPLLTREQERELGYRILEGDAEAKKEFASHNLKLVVSIARYYTRRGMELGDLIQEGNVGLLKAIDKFDITKGYKFSTYATWWIKQSITRALADKTRAIRLPVYLHAKVSNFKGLQAQFEKENFREPTFGEMSILMKEPIERIMYYEKLSRMDPTSLNTKVGQEEDTELGDFIQAEGESPEDVSINESLKEDVRKLIKIVHLTDRERVVIEERYGLKDDIPKTLQQIGDKFGVTRERIRQIEAKALRKLANPKYSSSVSSYIYGTDNVRLAKMRQYSKIKNDATDTMPTDMYVRYTKFEYIRNNLTEIFNKPGVDRILDVFSKKEAIILILYYGYIDNVLCTTEEIAKFLYMNVKEVERTINELKDVYEENKDLFFGNENTDQKTVTM